MGFDCISSLALSLYFGVHANFLLYYVSVFVNKEEIW